MRNLVRGYGEGRDQPQREARQKRRGDQYAVEGVMYAVTDDDQHTGRRVANIVAVVVTVMMMIMMVVVVVRVPAAVAAPTCVVPVGMRVPPQHELLDDEEDPEAYQERGADPLGTLRSNMLDRLRQQREKRGAQKRACRVTDEVRHQSAPQGFGYEEKQRRERRAGDATQGGEDDDPREQRQGLLASFRG